MTTDPTSADTHRVWLKAAEHDGKDLWGWQATRNGQVIAFGESTSEDHARRAAAKAVQTHARPLIDPV